MKNSNSVSKMHPELQSQLAALKEERENAVCAYELGDLVHIRGKLKLFRDMMEIVAYYHCILAMSTKIIVHNCLCSIWLT